VSAQLSGRAEQVAEPQRSTFTGKESMRTGEGMDIVAALPAEMLSDPWGEFSPSVYETARLVTRTPSLRGHARRLRFLLDHQNDDGGWGGPAGYSLVPTLSATEALLTALRQLPSGINYDDVVGSVDRGLRSLFERLNRGRPVALPDTVAVEIIVPGLIAEINAHLARLDRAPLAGLGAWHGGHRLIPHPGADGELLIRLRTAVGRGQPVPAKLLHSLEALGVAVEGARFVEPLRGCVGCSPAATATWLGDRAVRAGRHRSLRYLEAVQLRRAGLVPVAAPLAVFERAWVLATLAGAGLAVPAHRGLMRSLEGAFGEFGVAGGVGLPPDVDDTATALYVLARLGSPRRPDCLWAYRSDRHFVSYPAERTPSPSANAHVLQALGANLTPSMPHRTRCLEAIDGLIGWLCDQQRADGSWRDKWHASPFYATVCCAVALAEYGGIAAAGAVRRARRWVLDTQHPDGSWGWRAGTHEETAYAVQVLLRTSHRDIAAEPAAERAAALGCVLLQQSSADHEHPPLWHDKDLYTPVRIVRAEILAALHLGNANERVAALIKGMDPARAVPSGSEAC
jgi:halimadienyl-diphosphate synthase